MRVWSVGDICDWEKVHNVQCLSVFLFISLCQKMTGDILVLETSLAFLVGFSIFVAKIRFVRRLLRAKVDISIFNQSLAICLIASGKTHFKIKLRFFELELFLLPCFIQKPDGTHTFPNDLLDVWCLKIQIKIFRCWHNGISSLHCLASRHQLWTVGDDMKLLLINEHWTWWKWCLRK